MLPQQITVLHTQILFSGLPFHRVQSLDEQQYYFSSGFIVIQRLFELSSGVGKTTHQNDVFPLIKLFINDVAVRLQIPFVVFEQFYGTFSAPATEAKGAKPGDGASNLIKS